MEVVAFFDGSFSSLNIRDAIGQNVFRSDSNFDRVTEILSVAYDANGHSESIYLDAAGQPFLQGFLSYVAGSGKTFYHTKSP